MPLFLVLAAQIALLVMWYALPSFATVSAWVIFLPTIIGVVGFILFWLIAMVVMVNHLP